MTPNERNRFDHRDSLELGNAAQKIFKNIAVKRGWEVFPAVEAQDIDEHWDYSIKNPAGEEFKVDVKARKRKNRHDKNVQDEWAWIELHGVRKNDLGWLFGGKADLLAFERKDDFVIIKRERLQHLANSLVNKSISVQNPYEAEYKIYSRKDRNDQLAMIEMRHIVRDCWEIWLKTCRNGFVDTERLLDGQREI